MGRPGPSVSIEDIRPVFESRNLGDSKTQGKESVRKFSLVADHLLKSKDVSFFFEYPTVSSLLMRTMCVCVCVCVYLKLVKDYEFLLMGTHFGS